MHFDLQKFLYILLTNISNQKILHVVTSTPQLLFEHAYQIILLDHNLNLFIKAYAFQLFHFTFSLMKKDG